MRGLAMGARSTGDGIVVRAAGSPALKKFGTAPADVEESLSRSSVMWEVWNGAQRDGEQS